MISQTITITQSELDHRLKATYEDGYQKGLYDGIIAAEKNRQASRAVDPGAVDELIYDETIAAFLASTGRF